MKNSEIHRSIDLAEMFKAGLSIDKIRRTHGLKRPVVERMIAEVLMLQSLHPECQTLGQLRRRYPV